MQHSSAASLSQWYSCIFGLSLIYFFMVLPFLTNGERERIFIDIVQSKLYNKFLTLPHNGASWPTCFTQVYFSHFTFTYPVVWLTVGVLHEVVATSFLHPSLSMALCTVSQIGRPVHSFMLSFPLFLSILLHLPPLTVPGTNVLASPVDRPQHFSLHLFTVGRRSMYGPIAFWILFLTSSLVIWSFSDIPKCFWNHLMSSHGP